MTRATLTRRARRAINAAYKGGKLVDQIERELGAALTTELDGLWDDAEQMGENDRLVADIERAYNHLTEG